MSFQDELKNSIKTKDEAKRVALDKINAIAEYEANQLLTTIRSTLLNKVKDADYQQINGETVVSCICPLPKRYLHILRYNNNAQIIENNRRGIFKNRNIVYQTWYKCEIAEQYSVEYDKLVSIAKAKADADGISLNFVLYEKMEKKNYPIPSTLTGFHLECDIILSVEAKTIITK